MTRGMRGMRVILRIYTSIVRKHIIYLYSVFGQVGFDRQHFASVHVRIVGLFEGLLQLVELVAGENGATVTTLFLLFLAAKSVDTVNRKLFAGVDAVTWQREYICIKSFYILLSTFLQILAKLPMLRSLMFSIYIKPTHIH